MNRACSFHFHNDAFRLFISFTNGVSHGDERHDSHHNHAPVSVNNVHAQGGQNRTNGIADRGIGLRVPGEEQAHRPVLRERSY